MFGSVQEEFEETLKKPICLESLLELFIAMVRSCPVSKLPRLLCSFFAVPDDVSLTDSENSFDLDDSPHAPQPHSKDDKSLTHHALLHLTGNNSSGAEHEHELMNRHELKRNSTKVSADAARRQKDESRSKKLAERLVTQVEVDESGLANMAKFKSQQASSLRSVVLTTLLRDCGVDSRFITTL
jgi:hypothetical protein